MTREEFAKVMSEAIEEVAREEADRRNFDIAKESFGLMRAMVAVLSDEKLFAEARKRAQEKLNATKAVPPDAESSA